MSNLAISLTFFGLASWLLYNEQATGGEWATIIVLGMVLAVLVEIRDSLDTEEEIVNEPLSSKWCEQCPRENGALVYPKGKCPNHVNLKVIQNLPSH